MTRTAGIALHACLQIDAVRDTDRAAESVQRVPVCAWPVATRRNPLLTLSYSVATPLEPVCRVHVSRPFAS